MTEAHKKALLEATKEPLRLLILAVLPIGVTMLSGIDASWAIIATLILRAIDRYLHVAKKEDAGKKYTGESLGLVRF